MRTNTRVDKDHMLLVLLNQVQVILAKVREQELRPFGLNSQIQAGVLYHLITCNKPITIAEIAHRLLREPHTMSALLDRMERQGLVRKNRRNTGRNRIMLEITGKGKRVYKRTKGMNLIRVIFSHLNEEERDDLLAYLRVLRTEASRYVGRNLSPPFP